jgi:hypothetical protein
MVSSWAPAGKSRKDASPSYVSTGKSGEAATKYVSARAEANECGGVLKIGLRVSECGCG